LRVKDGALGVGDRQLRFGGARVHLLVWPSEDAPTVVKRKSSDVIQVTGAFSFYLNLS